MFNRIYKRWKLKKHLMKLFAKEHEYMDIDELFEYSDYLNEL